jgi:hypothetical protein
MGCSSCKKNRTINLSKVSNVNERLSLDSQLNGDKQVLFNGRLGKIVYFLILLIIALTPIPNLVAIYFFYLAIFGGTKQKKEEDNVEINQDKNNS